MRNKPKLKTKPAPPVVTAKTEESIEEVARQRLDILKMRRRETSSPHMLRKIEQQEEKVKTARKNDLENIKSRKGPSVETEDVDDISVTDEELDKRREPRGSEGVAAGQGDGQANQVTGREHKGD